MTLIVLPIDLQLTSASLAPDPVVKVALRPGAKYLIEAQFAFHPAELNRRRPANQPVDRAHNAADGAKPRRAHGKLGPSVLDP